MFTAAQSDLTVYYYDPESQRVRRYSPDFLAEMEDGSYQLIEVKGDHMIDNAVVLAKKDAAEEMSVASGMQYIMYAGSLFAKMNVLEDPDYCQTYFTRDSEGNEFRIDVEKGRK